MVQLPDAALRMSACFARRGVPVARRRSGADGILIMIRSGHLCGARREKRASERGVFQVRVSHASTLSPAESHAALAARRARGVRGLVSLQRVAAVSEQKIAGIVGPSRCEGELYQSNDVFE